MKDVIGFGAINLDLIYKVEDESVIRELKISETAISEKRFEKLKRLLRDKAELKLKSGGGSAANTVYALAKMGFETGYLGKVGKDEEGKFLRRSLRPVDTRRVSSGERSGICLVLVDGKERIIHILPNSNNSLSYDEIDLDYARKTKFLHLTSFAGDLPFQAQKKLVKKMSGGTCRLSFDPGRCYAQKGLKALLPIIAESYVVFPSEEEVKLLTGKNYRQGAKVLLNCGPKIVVCTRGAKGSYILSKDQEHEIITDGRVRVADPTGAGDVYAAGFLAGLLLNLPLKKCGQLGTKLAEISITGYGREKYPDEIILKRTITAIKA